MRKALIVVVAVAACGGSSSEETTTSAAPPATTTTTASMSTTTTASTTTTLATSTTTTLATSTTSDTTTSTTTAEPAITMDGNSVTINWEALTNPAFFAPPLAGDADPFWHIHTNPASDGFFLSIEAYTTGYGSAWTGELGRFAVDCSPGGTGICVHFDPDGPGPEGEYGEDFLATGELEFLQLDADGYEITIHEITFSNGVTIAGPVTISG